MVQYSIKIRLTNDIDLWVNENIYFNGDEFDVFYAPLLNNKYYYYPTVNEDGKKVIDWIPKSSTICIIDERSIN